MPSAAAEPATESIALIYAVFADDAEAQRVGRAVVEERLAACVNILGACRSIYRWQGTVAEADEVAAIFKTAGAQRDALIARIATLHSYDLPAISGWTVTAAAAGVMPWVVAETAKVS